MDESGKITKVQELATRVRESVQKVIVGKDRAISLSMVAHLCQGHILVEDVPGIGRARYPRTSPSPLAARSSASSLALT